MRCCRCRLRCVASIDAAVSVIRGCRYHHHRPLLSLFLSSSRRLRCCCSIYNQGRRLCTSPRSTIKGGLSFCQWTFPSSTLSSIAVTIAGVFSIAGSSVTYVVHVVNPPPRGNRTRGNTRRGRERSNSDRGRSTRGVGPAPGSISLVSVSGFLIAEGVYVVTNFHVVDRVCDMTLWTEERNAYAVKLISNVTNYIMVKRPPLSSTSLS